MNFRDITNLSGVKNLLDQSYVVKSRAARQPILTCNFAQGLRKQAQPYNHINQLR